MSNNGACRALFLREPAAPELPDALPNREEGSPAASRLFREIWSEDFRFGARSHSGGTRGTLQLGCGTGSLLSRSHSGAHSRTAGALGPGVEGTRVEGTRAERARIQRSAKAPSLNLAHPVKCCLPAPRRWSLPTCCACATPTVRSIPKLPWWPCNIIPAKPWSQPGFFGRFPTGS